MLVTYTGRTFDYNNITKESINVLDVIHSLVGINRFNGHSSRDYSVGEHTLMCLIMAEKLGLSNREKLLVLIHDFTEAYVGDCPAPLKAHLPEFVEIEEKVELAILDYLGIKRPTDEEYKTIKRIDLTMLVIEMRDLTLHDHEKYTNENTHLQFLEDDDFALNKAIFNKENLKNCLKDLFDTVYTNYLIEVNNNEKI